MNGLVVPGIVSAPQTVGGMMVINFLAAVIHRRFQSGLGRRIARPPQQILEYWHTNVPFFIKAPILIVVPLDNA